MTYIRYANFFQIFTVSSDGTENIEAKYNNSTPGQSIRHRWNQQVVTYEYLSFVYQGASKNRTGDNLEAQLLLSVNDLANNEALSAVRNKKHIRMFSALMRENFTVERVLTQEVWLASSLSYDNETLEVILSSAIDAVGANAPTRVLSRDLVGHLPVTGNIQAL